MRRVKSTSSLLVVLSPQTMKSSKSFHSFDTLMLHGQQVHQSFGSVARNTRSTKASRRRAIMYFYRQLRLRYWKKQIQTPEASRLKKRSVHCSQSRRCIGGVNNHGNLALWGTLGNEANVNVCTGKSTHERRGRNRRLAHAFTDDRHNRQTANDLYLGNRWQLT